MTRFSGALTSLAVSCSGAIVAAAVGAPAHAGPAAAIDCTSPGLPVGCLGRPAVRALGVGVGPNMGGPVNRGGLR